MVGLIPGTYVLIRPVGVEKKRILEQDAFKIAAGIVVYALSLGGVLSRLDGGVLLAESVAYLYYCTMTARTRHERR